MRPRAVTFRVGLSLIVCASLLITPEGLFRGLLRVSDAAQGRSSARPRPGKPEGVFPDLEDVKKESGIEREAPPPIPSTIRSPKSPLQPWNGKRVGDPGTRGESGQSVARYHRIRRAPRRSHLRCLTISLCRTSSIGPSREHPTRTRPHFGTINCGLLMRRDRHP